MSTFDPVTARSKWVGGDSQGIGSVSSTPTPEKSFLSHNTLEVEDDADCEDAISNWIMSSVTEEQYHRRKQALWNCYHKKHSKWYDSAPTDKYTKSAVYRTLVNSWTTNFGSNLTSNTDYAPINSFYSGTQTLDVRLGVNWQYIHNEVLGDSDSYKPKAEFTEIAIRRSERLLDRMLSSKQRKYWHRNRYIDIQSPAYPTRLYRIPEHGKVLCFDSGKLTKRLCIYSIDRMPLADKMVALKVMIESDEQEFLRIAIPHPVVHADEGGFQFHEATPVRINNFHTVVRIEAGAIEMENGMAMKDTPENRMIIMKNRNSRVEIIGIDEGEEATERIA